MPFNGSGTFSIVNTFVPNTTILSAAVNANFTDIATGLSDCLTRDGQAGMTAIFKAISGSVSAPGITFNSDLTAGLFLQNTGIVGLVAKSLGLLVNSSILQVASATIQAGGTNYAVGDTVKLTGGTAINQAILTVATLTGSAIATVTVAYPGNYSVAPSNPVSQFSTDGSGSGATFNLTFAAQYSSSIVTDETGNLPWVRLGSSSFVSGLMAKVNAYDYITALVTAGAGITISNSTSPPTVTASAPTLTGAVGLIVVNDGVTPNTKIDISADQVVLVASATSKYVAGASVVIDTTTNGANGLDTGAKANSTWYNLFLISNGSTTAGLASLSATAPTMPSGYTFLFRCGAMQTDGSGNFFRTRQIGNIAQYQIIASTNTPSNGIVPMLLGNGIAGTYSTTSPVLTTATVTGNTFAAPPTATAVELTIQSSWKGGSASNVIVAPTTAWGGTNNGEQGSVGMTYPLATTALSSATPISVSAWMNLEASTVAWASSAAGGVLQCFAWKDKVNAT